MDYYFLWITHHNILGADAEISVDHEFLGAERRRLFELGREEDADAGDQLELILLDRDLRHESVHVVDGEGEDLGLALLLLANLEHPIDDDLPHVGFDL